jgi:PAS domain S-box-containing protein
MLITKQVDIQLGDFFFQNLSPMWVYEGESGCFLAVNDAAIDAFGYEEQEFLNMTVTEFLTEATLEKLNTPIKDFKNPPIWEIINKNGETVFVKLTQYQTQFNGTNCFLLSAIDCTQFKKQEAIHKEEIQHLNSQTLVANFTNNLVIIVDDTGRISWVNNAFVNTMQYTIDEIIGKRPSEFIHGPLSDLNTAARIKEAIKNKQAFKEEIIHYTKSQTPVWIFAEGQPVFDFKNKLIRYIIIETDITNQKQQQEQLNRSESELHAFFNSSGSLLVLLDTELNVTAFNNKAQLALEEILHSTIQIGKPILELLPNEVKETFKHFAAEALAGRGTENREAKLPGHGSWWNMRYLPLYNSFGEIFGASFTAIDITDRIKKEMLLVESEKRYSLVTQATFDAIWDWDIQQNTLYRGEGFFTLFGYETGTLKNDPSTWDNLIHPDDFKRVVADFQKILDSDTTNWIEEYQFLKSNGSYAFVRDKAIIIRDETGKAIRMVGAMQDITADVLKEQQLKIYEYAIKKTSDAVVITSAQLPNSSDVKITFVNDAFVKMTGYSFEEVLGKSPRILQGPLTDKNEILRLKNAIINWLPCEIETINYTKNGEAFWVNISTVPVADESGWFTHWIAIQKDMTDRRKQMEERELMIEELTKNNRELKQFSYITSHNLRAPLTNMIGIFNLLDLSVITDNKMLQLMDGLKVSTIKLNETLNDLIKVLIVKENVHIELEDVSFNNAFNKAVSSVSKILANSNAIIDIDFSQVSSVRFSNMYMESIFFNLLTNAIKFQHPGNRPEIKIKTTFKNNIVELHISDNGVGMDWQKVKNKIFGLYQKFHNNQDSKGIGLYLVHSQVNALGGSIKLHTELDKGSTFTISFNSKQ